MGSFDGRVWKQKRQRLTWLLRWAYNLKGSMPEERVSTWVVDKATQRYATWRDGEEFSRMLQSVKLNTERFWMQQCPDMKVEELHNKVSLMFRVLRIVRLCLFFFSVLPATPP